MMKTLFFALSLIAFSFFIGTSEAVPEIQRETVALLKPKLNSDRIEYFFGSYGVDALKIESPVFPASRIANLYSIHQGKKIMRTLAVVDFFQPISSDLQEVHREIIEGKSIGIALRDRGWIVHKKPIYFGVTSLSPELMKWMDEPTIDQAALHIYRLEVSRKGQSEMTPYCTIIELYSPQYLTEEWLQALYGDQYQEFSIKTEEVVDLLCRLLVLIQNFPLSPARNL